VCSSDLVTNHQILYSKREQAKQNLTQEGKVNVGGRPKIPEKN
jgi:hypothetical protein